MVESSEYQELKKLLSVLVNISHTIENAPYILVQLEHGQTRGLKDVVHGYSVSMSCGTNSSSSSGSGPCGKASSKSAARANVDRKIKEYQKS